MPTKTEGNQTRDCSELRETSKEGFFSGYLTVWEDVDSHNSRFAKGSFTKTIKEQGERVKVLYNHSSLIGKALVLREDDYGLYAEGQLNMEVEKARDTLSFMLDGTLDGLSFMFKSIKQKYENGVLVIKEVRLFEFGPVDFPSGDTAIITNVREQQQQERSTDFKESLLQEELYDKEWVLRYALSNTLSDVWWQEGLTKSMVVEGVTKAINDYKLSYLDFVDSWVATMWTEEQQLRESPHANALANAFNKELSKRGSTVNELASYSEFTMKELTLLRNGQGIEKRDKVADLGEEVNSAFKEQRNKKIESLCNELRGTLTAVEKERFLNLLAPVNERQYKPTLDTTDTLNFFQKR